MIKNCDNLNYNPYVKFNVNAASDGELLLKNEPSEVETV